MADPKQRYVVMWREPPPNVLDWSHWVAENLDEVREVVENLKKQGVHQFAVYVLGDKLPELSSVH